MNRHRMIVLTHLIHLPITFYFHFTTLKCIYALQIAKQHFAEMKIAKVRKKQGDKG